MEEFNEAFREINPFDKLKYSERNWGEMVQICVRQSDLGDAVGRVCVQHCWYRV